MPAQFVLGRAGSGKTTYLLEQIEKQIKAEPLGSPIYWLLPRQATFQTERLLTARLGCFTRVKVVSFDQLGKDILSQCGDVGIPEVTTVGRRMVIGHLLRLHQKQLKYYSASAHRSGLASELDSTFGELERAGLDVLALENLVNSMESDGPQLRDKLFDLHFLLNAYNKFIGNDKRDPQRRLTLILQQVADCALLKNAEVFVDDFYDFTAHERKLLTAIAGVASCTVISLLLDPASPVIGDDKAILSDLSTFHRTERTFQSLRESLLNSAIAIEPPILMMTNHRFASDDLRAVESNLFSNQVVKAQPSGVDAFEAPDSRGEVDAVARKVRALIAEGIRYRQIGVLVRDLGEYQQIISASFAEHGLPFFADHRRTAAHHPLLQMVRAALLIAKNGWPQDAVMSLAKSGLSGLTDDQCDELENYVLKHRIRGRMWESEQPWFFKRELISAEDESGLPVLSETDCIDAYRNSLLTKLTPLLELGRSAQLWKIRDIASRLFDVLEAFNVRETLVQWIANANANDDLETSAEHEQVWREFADLLNHMVELLGEESIALADFLSVLDSGLESFDLALAPVKVDQILVGQIDRTRTPDLKVVFVLGLNEGTFPRVENEQCVITDRERRTLRRKNIELDTDSYRRLLDERFLAYLVLTRASQQLIVSRPTATAKGRVTNPSAFWLELLRLLPGLSVTLISKNTQSVGSPRQLVTMLLKWARSSTDDAKAASLYQWLATTSQNNFATMRDYAWKALHYDNAATLEPSLANQLFETPLQAPVRQIETMAECPFRHFSRYGLSLRQRDEPEITNIDLSNAYHDILEKLVADLLEADEDWCNLDPAVAAERIHIHAAEIGRRLRGELMLSNARNRYLLDRIERTLEQGVATMCELHRRGKYRPAHVSLKFGNGGKLPAYQVLTPNGQQVHLHGKIDRIDLNEKKSAFVVADYKLSAGTLQLDRVYHGLSLQLLTYLLVIQANGEQLTGRELSPAAAFLLQLLRSPQTVDHPSEAIAVDHEDFHLTVKPRGLIETRAIKSLDTKLQDGQSKVIGAYINKDGQPGKRHISDIADQADFEALLLHVEQRLGELADQVFTGDVAVAPYMIARQTPCARCEYRSVCRFEPGTNRYRMLQAMKREDVLRVVSGRENETPA